jgi:hypothetical protein
VLVDGPRALEVARELAELLPDYEPVVPIAQDERDAAASAEVSALLDSGALPVADRAMRGVAWVGGTPGAARLAELLRVCRPTGRLVIETAAARTEASAALDAAAEALGTGGAEVRARDGTGLMAVAL